MYLNTLRAIAIAFVMPWGQKHSYLQCNKTCLSKFKENENFEMHVSDRLCPSGAHGTSPYRHRRPTQIPSKIN